MLIGDAALHSAFDDPTPHHDLGRLWQERTGLPMVYAVWACREGVEDGLEELERAHLRALAVARAEPEALARRASEFYGWPPGFLARYFEKLRYHFGPREQQGVLRFFELAASGRRAGRGARAAVRRVPEGGDLDGGGRPDLRHPQSPTCSTGRLPASGSPTPTQPRCCESRELVRIGRVAHELRNRRNRPTRSRS